MCVEVFCGQARLSRALRELSFQVFSIDHKPFKNVQILQIDLNSDIERRWLEDLIEQCRVLYIHFAPPCGTASAARNIRLSKKAHGPPPLRSFLHPMGRPGNSPSDAKRVQLANSLYQYTVALVLKLHEQGIQWSIENPASSLMWLTKPFRLLQQRLRGQFHGFVFDTCMYGSRRLKHTALWTSMQELLGLAKSCDGQHQHDQWGRVGNKFARSLECAYNGQLSAAWAQCVRQHAVNRGIKFPAATLETVSLQDSGLVPQYNKAALGLLPRGKKLPPVMTDLLHGQEFDISRYPALQKLEPGTRLPTQSPFPPGSRLLRFANDKRGASGNLGEVGKQQHCAIIGIPREPMEYIKEVVKLVHPADMEVLLDTAVDDAIKSQLHGDGLKLRAKRIAWAKRLTEQCIESHRQEVQLKESMPGHLKKILKAKRLVVFKRVLQEIGYADVAIADEIASGFRLLGWVTRSGVFPSKVRPPTLHKDMLRKMASSFSARAIATIRSTGDSGQDLELWKATMDEVAAGFITGPVDRRDLPSDAVVSPRFALQQIRQ